MPTDLQPVVIEDEISLGIADRWPSPFLEDLSRPFAYTRTWTLLTFFIAIGSLARVAAVFHHNPLEILITDPGRWWFEATHWSDMGPMAAIDPFGYPIWLGLLIKLTGGSELALAVHNSILSVLTPWIWHRLVRELTADRDLAYAAWAVFCCVPSWIAIYSYTMSETLLLPLFGFALWMIFRARRVQSVGAYMLAATAAVLACSTRVFALPFCIAGLLWVLLHSQRRLLKLCSAVLVFAVVAIPLAWRSQNIVQVARPFGFPEILEMYRDSGKKTVRFTVTRDHGAYRWYYEFGSPSFYQEPFQPISHWTSARSGIVYAEINEEHGKADWDRALKQNQVPWPAHLRLLAENYLFFYFAPSWPDSSSDRLPDRLQIMLRWIWVPLATMVLLGNFRYRSELRGTAAAVFAVLTTIAWTLSPLSPAVMEGRYRKPVEGLLIVNLFLLVQCWKKIPTVSNRESVPVPSQYRLP